MGRKNKSIFTNTYNSNKSTQKRHITALEKNINQDILNYGN